MFGKFLTSWVLVGGSYTAVITAEYVRDLLSPPSLKQGPKATQVSPHPGTTVSASSKRSASSMGWGPACSVTLQAAVLREVPVTASLDQPSGAVALSGSVTLYQILHPRPLGASWGFCVKKKKAPLLAGVRLCRHMVALPLHSVGPWGIHANFHFFSI